MYIRGNMKSKKKQIAPRLANGESRDNYGGRLPPRIKAALRLIANDENKSMSWVMEEVVIKFFGMRRPAYKRRKVKK